MTWDYSQRRKSRYCLFPESKIDPGANETCGESDTDQDGLCPLHRDLPYQHMTDAAWAEVKKAIGHRWAAAEASDAAWDEVRKARNRRAEAKADRFEVLEAKLRAGKAFDWNKVPVTLRLRAASSLDLHRDAAITLWLSVLPKNVESDRDSWAKIRAVLATRPGMPGDVIDAMLRDDVYEVSKGAASKQDLADLGDHHDTIEQCVTDVDVRWCLLSNRTLPAPVIVRLARSIISGHLIIPNKARWIGGVVQGKPEALAYIARHPNTPVTLIREILSLNVLGYHDVAQVAAYAPVDDALLRELADSKWKTVRDAAKKRLDAESAT